nr:hypothetical protein [Tanacetum cinerariifolium]
MDQNIDSSDLDQIQTPQYSFIDHPSQDTNLQIINEELAEYINCPSWNRPIFLNDNEEHSVQYKECLENSSNFDIRQLIREECCIEVCREQKKKMEDTMLELLEVYPKYSLSMGYENLSTPPEMKSDEVNKSSVEKLVPIPSEYEVTSDNKRECDVPVCEVSSTFDVCEDHYEILSDSNNDDISSDDDALEDIEYVEASPLDSELVSLEEENDVCQEEEEFNLEDILQIQDVILREKLLSINRLIADIESLNDNPTPDSLIRKKREVVAPLTHANKSLPEYDSFCFEIEPDQGRLTSVVMKDISADSSNDPLLEEVDLFLASDNSIPPGANTSS